MRTFAVKERSNAKQRQVEANRAVIQSSHRSLSSGVLQRQLSCACGGGCPRCQTKLKISEPGDRDEQEADHIADQVMRMPEPLDQRQIEPETEEAGIQRQAILNPIPSLYRGLAQPDVTPMVHEVLGSPGKPLDPATRAFFEPRFGYDFSQVRVHTDPKAAESAHSINARAYTAGRNIVFHRGQYAPQMLEGQRLLAHELTHVVQQGGVNPGTHHRGNSWSTAWPPVENKTQAGVQREEFGEEVRFDSLPGSPPRAYVLGPYEDTAIAEALYGDPTIPITSLSETELLIKIDYGRLLPQWKPFFRNAVEEEPEAGNRWPFVGFPADEMPNYIDERTTAVAVNLVLGVAVLTVEGSDRKIEVPLRIWSKTSSRFHVHSGTAR